MRKDPAMQGADSEPPEDVEEQAFIAGLPSDPLFGPRFESRVVCWAPSTLEELVIGLTSFGPEWIWRGQGRSAWHLETRIAREFALLPPPEGEGVSWDFLGMENRVIGFFKERARRALAAPPDELDLLGWLALMQHYGAPTRLLDWTSSPFVALWFASENRKSDQAAVWGLNAYHARRQLSGSLFPGGWDHLGVIGHSTTDAEGKTTLRWPALETRQRDRENEFIRWAIRVQSRWPLPVIPFDTDARMAAQQTVLTAIGDLTRPVDVALLDFETWWRDKPSEAPPGGYRIGTDSTIWPLREPADVLVKFIIPPDWRGPTLAILATMGIDASTLFPGLDGAGRQTVQYLSGGRGTLSEIITDTWGA